MPTPIGVFDSVQSLPLIHAFETSAIPNPFTFKPGDPAGLARALEANRLSVTLLSVVDYGRRPGRYQIVPGVGLATDGASRTAVLVFRDGVKRIDRVVLDPAASTEAVLAKIVLLEKYDTEPSFTVAPTADLDRALQSADAALLVGDAALTAPTDCASLDLTDEWADLSDGLPFVLGLWVGQEESLSPAEIAALQAAQSHGAAHLGEIAALAAARTGVDPDAADRFFGHHLRTELTPERLAGLEAFFRYAFFHGHLDALPALNFFS